MEVVGGVASIAQLIDTLSKTIRYLNAVKKAPKERSDLLIQATDLSARLAKLQLRHEQSQQTPRAAWNEGIQSLDTVLALFEKKLQAITEKLTEKHGVEKAVQTFKWPFDKASVLELLDDIQRVNLLVVLALQEDSRELSLAIKDDTNLLPKLGHLLGDVQDQVTQLRRNEDASKIQLMTDWFSPLNFLTTQAETLANSQPYTGTWFLTHAKLQKWMADLGQVLWAPGIPGAGKTIMTSIVVEHLTQKFANDSNTRIAVAYCSYRDEQTQSLSNIMSGLWRQIINLNSNHSEDFQELHKKHTKSNTRPTAEQITKVLQTEIKKHDRIFFVVDALDELPHHTIETVVSTLRALDPKINFLFTSRNLGNISELFLDTPTIEISAQDEDITTYIQSQIRQNSKLAKVMQRFPDLHNETIRTIVSSAENMFLLAKLYMESLARQPRVRDFRKALQTLPSGLDATYNAAMQRIQQTDETGMGVKILYWVAFATRPLEFIELDHALAVEPGDTFFDEESRLLEDITSLCAGLIEIMPVSNIVRLAHYTTQAFLVSEAQTLFPSCSNDMVLTCLTYLSFDELVTGNKDDAVSVRDLSEKYPFLEYAAMNWGTHYASISEVDLQLHEKVLDFLQLDYRASDALISRQQFKIFHEENSTSLTGFHLAALFNLKQEAEKLSERVSYLEHQSEWTVSPLDWAVELDRQDIVAIFIRAGADASDSGPSPSKPLHVAASQGHSNMIRLLLELGADPNIRVGAFEPNCWHLEILRFHQTPLHEACLRGHVEAARILIEHGADVNLGMHLRPDTTPLFWAIDQVDERTELIDLLLDNGAQVNFDDTINASILRRSLSILQKLIDHGLDVNHKSAMGKHALDTALEHQEKGKIKLLLDNGATTGLAWTEDQESVSMHKDEEWYGRLKDALKISKTRSLAAPELAGVRSDKKAFTRNERDISYLDVDIPPSFSMPVSTIVIQTESHDQGWSSYPDDHGTYSNSHSWFELRVAGEGVPELVPCRFQSNIHGSSKWRVHTNTLDRSDMSGNALLLMDELKPGTTLKLFARAEFPGWVNYVKFARMQVFGSK